MMPHHTDQRIVANSYIYLEVVRIREHLLPPNLGTQYPLFGLQLLPVEKKYTANENRDINSDKNMF